MGTVGDWMGVHTHDLARQHAGVQVGRQHNKLIVVQIALHARRLTMEAQSMVFAQLAALTQAANSKPSRPPNREQIGSWPLFDGQQDDIMCHIEACRLALCSLHGSQFSRNPGRPGPGGWQACAGQRTVACGNSRAGGSADVVAGIPEVVPMPHLC